MTINQELSEKTLSLRMQRAASTAQNLGHSVVKILDIIPSGGAHAYRRGKIGQLRVEEITLTEPRHSKDSGDAFLSVEGIKGPPEQPLEPQELHYQPLITHKDYTPPFHQPSWITKDPPQH